MTRSEFLKAIRALSARYVERRGTLPDRSPLDSAGKRAAFAGFYAPLHFLTARAIVSALGPSVGALDTIVDIGCGTGVAGAAWAAAMTPAPSIRGVDMSAWALEEAHQNWRDLGLRGRTTRGDFVAELGKIGAASGGRGPLGHMGLMCGWSLNELPAPARESAERALRAIAARGARILVIEPVAGRLVPWWSDFAKRSVAAGARADTWRFTDPLPPALAALDRDAGFSRDGLTARSVVFNW